LYFASFVSASLLAFIINRKFAEHVPLYRQEQQFINFGIDISRADMANWVIKGSELLEPVYDLLHNILLKQNFIHCDETTMQVLSEPGVKATSKSYMWHYGSGRYGPNVKLYEYQPSRAANHPKKFLTGFNGYIQTDGYAGYNSVENVEIMGCFAHVRRKFVDALKALPKDADESRTLSQRGKEYCDKLFMLEREYTELDPEQRLEVRINKSKPVFDEFYEWLAENKDVVLPKSALGKAISYSLNQWDKLETFLKNGEVELSNNAAEVAIKPFVLSRKNFLFAKSPKGAKASAILFSIMETAKANNLSPFHYLEYLFEQIPNINVNDDKELKELLPWSDDLPEDIKVSPKLL